MAAGGARALPNARPPSTGLPSTTPSPLPPPTTHTQVCYALSQLASGFYETRGTSPMSPYFKDVVQALLETVREQEGGL